MAEQQQSFDPQGIADAVAQIDATKLQPIIRKAADDLYEAVLNTVEDYVRENADGNLRSHLAMLETENARMRRELYEADRIIGGNYMSNETRVAQLLENDRKLVERLVLREAMQTVVSDCQLAFDALGNSPAEFDSVRSGFGIIADRARAALASAQAAK